MFLKNCDNFWRRNEISCVRPFFLITWFTDPPTWFFRIFNKKKSFFTFSKKWIFWFFSNFFFFTNFQLQVPSPDKGGLLLSAAVQLYPLANKLWSPAHNEREELEPTDPVQGYDTISINDTEIRKQLSKMGRNKAYELDNLLIEAIIMVAELNLLLKDYTAEDNGKWYPR